MLGILFVCMPMNSGITLACYEALKKNYQIQVFVQGKQIAVWLKDSDIEPARSLFANGILPFGARN